MRSAVDFVCRGAFACALELINTALASKDIFSNVSKGGKNHKVAM